VYALGDIVVTGNYHYHLCVVSHTSSTTFPPDDAFWETVFDATNVVLDTEAAATNAANSAAAASASAAEAATSADVAEQAASLAVTAQSAFRWNFDASTVTADPGMGKLRFDNTTLINITQLMLNAQSADFGNPNVSGWVITWDDSTNLTSRGSIYVRNAVSPENFLVFDVNGPVIDNGTWQSVTVKYIAHGGTLADGDNLAVAFTRTGNAGTSGSGAGDMLSTNNLSDVADPVAAADNIGVGPTDTPPFVQVVLSSPTTIPNHAARKEYVDSAINTRAPLDSPALTGSPTAPTPTAGDNDTSIATTAFVTAADAALQTSIKTYVDNQDALKADITYVNAQDALKAPIASPTFTGDPKAPTPSAGDNDTTIATTAFVVNTVQSKAVAKTGDTMTGNLLINGVNPYFGLNKAASGQINQIYGYTNSSVRWEMDLGSGAAESGGNAGSDFLLSRFNDAGAWLNTAMLITRSTGAVNFYSTLNAPTVVASGDVSASHVIINSAGYVLVDTAKFYSDANQSTWYYNGDACFANYTKANGNLQFTVNGAMTFQHVFGAHAFYVDGSAWKPGGSVWSDSSDIRIKNVQGEYKTGLDAVAALQPITYTFKGNDTLEAPDYVRTQAEKEEAARKARETDVPEAPVSVPYPNSLHYQVAKDQKLFHGLIAQEVEKVFPEMISKRAGFLNGEPVSDIRDMDTTPLIYALINAIKELKARVEALES
jgi:hypothetical protein